MNKILHVAIREFIATVATKAFILGVVLPPAIMGMVLFILPLLMNKASPKITGHIAIIDHTGTEIGPSVRESLREDKIAERMAESGAKQLEELDAPPEAQAAAKSMSEMSGNQAAGQAPNLTVEVLPESTDVDAAKAEILAAGKSKSGEAANPRLALAVIPKGTITAGADGGFATFELFTAPKLDFEVQRDIQREIGNAIVDGRIRTAGLDPKAIRTITDRPRGDVKSVTADGDQKINDAAKLLLPGAFMMLLWISTFTCGQYLLTSTIEEKSSRVMEVILSAVSPLQLLTGKIVGQMAVGLVILIAYCGLGIGGLFVASMMSILPLANLIYLFVYFIIAFFMIASLMAAVGSAVSDIKEAQSMLGPIMIVLVIPLMLWFPILRNPNSTFATVCSFIPPISPFVMILRLSGSEPVPMWQVPATIVLGGLSIVVALWAAAKVFRVGVLMYGKPPNFTTLVRWIRMA